MKDLYSFSVSFVSPTSKKKEKVEIVIKKPNNSMIENAEFYYACKFNEYLNAGFLSKAMVQKKISDLGGVLGKSVEENITNEISNIFDAQKVVQFYSSSSDEDLTEEQKQKLDKAKKLLSKSQKILVEYNTSLSSMFNQTADVKAQEKLIKWLALFCCFYKEQIGEKVNEFELFQGVTLKEKEAFYAKILDEEYDESDLDLSKKAEIIKAASSTIGKVLAIWYNGLASDQKTIKEQLASIEREEKENKDLIDSFSSE
jgi:hypothetical protein